MKEVDNLLDMKQIGTVNRDQLLLSSLDLMVDPNSEVRLIDVFVDSALRTHLGFKVSNRTTGRPSFPLRTFLGIYIYGYLNRIRSSRQLEKSCLVNVEMMWLVKGHKPCYKTIANFRKDNTKGFSNLFKLFRSFCLEQDLYGKEIVAIDGSKFRAQNSMKNNFNEKKIQRHLEYIDYKQQEYIDSLDNADTEENLVRNAKWCDLEQRSRKYKALQKELKNSSDSQISTTDPDARALPLHMRIVEVGYNVQSAVDDKNNLIVSYEVTNKNDSRALSAMAIKSKKALGLSEDKDFVVLADKGYHTGNELQKCHDKNIDTIVSVPKRSKLIDKTKPRHLQKENFVYNKDRDTYTCPNGHVLTKQATYKRKDRKGIESMKFDRYSIKHTTCVTCPCHKECVSPGKRKASQGRYLDRYHTDEAVLRNKKYLQENKALYKRRQAIVEHPFGTIKRAWGYNYTMLRTIPKVETEFSIIMLCYNLRRTMSILGLDRLKEALKAIFRLFLRAESSMCPHNIIFFRCHPQTP